MNTKTILGSIFITACLFTGTTHTSQRGSIGNRWKLKTTKSRGGQSKPKKQPRKSIADLLLQGVINRPSAPARRGGRELIRSGGIRSPHSQETLPEAKTPTETFAAALLVVQQPALSPKTPPTLHKETTPRKLSLKQLVTHDIAEILDDKNEPEPQPHCSQNLDATRHKDTEQNQGVDADVEGVVQNFLNEALQPKSKTPSTLEIADILEREVTKFLEQEQEGTL